MNYENVRYILGPNQSLCWLTPLRWSGLDQLDTVCSTAAWKCSSLPPYSIVYELNCSPHSVDPQPKDRVSHSSPLYHSCTASTVNARNELRAQSAVCAYVCDTGPTFICLFVCDCSLGVSSTAWLWYCLALNFTLMCILLLIVPPPPPCFCIHEKIALCIFPSAFI